MCFASIYESPFYIDLRREIIQKRKYIETKRKKAEKLKRQREIAAMPESERPAKPVQKTLDNTREKDETIVTHDDEEVS